MKPIPFNTEMVRAILDGRKTVTRRLVRRKELGEVLSSPARKENQDIPDRRFIECLCTVPYEAGDILWVRETWTSVPDGSYIYKASVECPDAWRGTWHPSLHMPREAARIFLRVKDVRVERLQEITAEGVLDEGTNVEFPQPKPSYLSLAYAETRLKPAARQSFAKLWDSTIKPADRPVCGWQADPWVWVIRFERIEKERWADADEGRTAGDRAAAAGGDGAAVRRPPGEGGSGEAGPGQGESEVGT